MRRVDEMTIDLRIGMVRILQPNDRTAGAGFVVTDDGLIATCARVVEAPGAGPDDSVGIVPRYQHRTIRLWLPQLDTLRDLACQKVRQNLTKGERERYLPSEPYRQTCPNLPPDNQS
jgi:hypothetical protein